MRHLFCLKRIEQIYRDISVTLMVFLEPMEFESFFLNWPI